MTAGERDFLTTGLNARATPAMVRSVARIAAAIALLILVAFPFRSIVIGLLQSVYIIYGTALVAGYALSGLLLAWWSRRSSNASVAMLSATYLFSATMVLTNVILILEPNRPPAVAQASLWLWVLWHFGLPLGILVSTQQRLAIGSGLRSAVLAAVGASGAAFLFAWFGSRHLILTENGRITTVFWVACAVAGAVAALALWRLLRRGRSSALDLLLALVLITVVGDLGLVLSSPLGYSVGTYAARAMGLLSGLIVVGTFVRWMIATIERSDMFTQYATIAEGAPSITFLTSERGDDVIYMNERWTELTGRPTAQALGKGWQEIVHPDDLSRRLATPQWYRSDDNLLRLRDRDGDYVWHLARYGAVRDRSGRQIGWVGTATNIDRERRALDESRRLAEQLSEQYKSEREIAVALRAALLPSLLMRDFDGVHFSAVYRPVTSMDQIGGDWYDTFVLPDGVIVFTMGDVSGHGLSAAASMLRLREGLRMAAFTEKAPGRALGLMNRMLMMNGDLFATALVAFVDPHRGRMTVSAAGHPAPVLVRRGVASTLPVRGIVLGASASEAFEELTLSLEPDDEIAFYTDGLIECEKTPIEGEQRLLEALENAEADRLESLVDVLLSRGQADDATIVLLSYHAESSVSWHFRSDNADSAQLARSAFCYHLARSGVDPAAISRAELVFGELVGNVVRHAPGPIEINLAFIAGDAVLSVRDRGPGFEPHGNRLPDQALSEGGRGLFLVEAYAGSTPLFLHRQQGGMKVIVTIGGAGGLNSAA